MTKGMYPFALISAEFGEPETVRYYRKSARAYSAWEAACRNPHVKRAVVHQRAPGKRDEIIADYEADG